MKISIIMQARKTLLFNDNKPWVKSLRINILTSLWGCFNGAEVSDIIRTYIINKISNEINKNQVGLYRDVGLGVLRNMSGSEMDRTRKNLNM